MKGPDSVCQSITTGDRAAKAKAELGWEPRVKFEELVKMMVEADLEDVKGR